MLLMFALAVTICFVLSVRAIPADENGADDKAICRILIIADHRILCEGLKLVLTCEKDMEICGLIDSCHKALSAVERHRPDMVILDLSLKDGSAIELLKRIRSDCPEVKILTLSSRDEAFYVIERVFQAGAKGYVARDEGPENLIDAIRKVHMGQIYISDVLASRMVKLIVTDKTSPDAPLEQKLTEREIEIFDLIGRGMTSRAIADKLHLSIKTIGAHRENIKNKLRIKNATDLLKEAVQWVHLPGESKLLPPSFPPSQ